MLSWHLFVRLCFCHFHPLPLPEWHRKLQGCACPFGSQCIVTGFLYTHLSYPSRPQALLWTISICLLRTKFHSSVWHILLPHLGTFYNWRHKPFGWLCKVSTFMVKKRDNSRSILGLVLRSEQFLSSDMSDKSLVCRKIKNSYTFWSLLCSHWCFFGTQQIYRMYTFLPQTLKIWKYQRNLKPARKTCAN